jgi:hypothetical protein
VSADSVSSGNGTDTASYVRDSGVTVTLDGAANDGGPSENDNVAADVENRIGSRAAEVLTGNASANDIDGGAGDGGGSGDTISALGGDDVLHANTRFAAR